MFLSWVLNSDHGIGEGTVNEVGVAWVGSWGSWSVKLGNGEICKICWSAGHSDTSHEFLLIGKESGLHFWGSFDNNNLWSDNWSGSWNGTGCGGSSGLLVWGSTSSDFTNSLGSGGWSGSLGVRKSHNNF